MVSQKWIWFDLDETLHCHTGAVGAATRHILSDFALRASLPLSIVEEKYDLVLKAQVALRFSDGRLSQEYRRERFEGVLRDSRLSALEIDGLIAKALIEYEDIAFANLKLKDGAMHIIDRLRNANYRLAVLTDAPQDIQIRVLTHLGLVDLFDAIYTAGALRRSKPQGMMNVVMEKMGLEPEQIVMIGDSVPNDIVPAIAAGIRPIWFNEHRLPNPDNYIQIHNLTELSEILL